MGCELCGGDEDQYCSYCEPDYVKMQNNTNFLMDYYFYSTSYAQDEKMQKLKKLIQEDKENEMNKRVIDIGYGELDVYVDKQLVLHIGQVSDKNTINLFLYSEGDIVESTIHEEDPTSRCTHEIIVERKDN